MKRNLSAMTTSATIKVPKYLHDGRAAQLFRELQPAARPGVDADLLAAYCFGLSIIEKAKLKLSRTRNPRRRKQFEKVIAKFEADARMFASHLYADAGPEMPRR